MKLLVISGLSGAGKSVAMHLLEDLDYFCVDNLPLDLLPALAERLISHDKPEDFRAAVAVDARNTDADFTRFPAIVDEISALGVSSQVIFLEAKNDVLIKRFSETRRKHPLTMGNLSLTEALERERRLLDPVRRLAQLCIDTTDTPLHRLRDIIRQRVDSRPGAQLTLLFESFGFKHGVPPDADLVFDVRCLPNPYWQASLRQYTGLDKPVRDFLADQPPVNKMAASLEQFLDTWIPAFEAENRTYLTVAIGCTGGHHRSVYLADRLGKRFADRRGRVLVRHRELSL